MPDTSGPFDASTWAEADWYRTMVSALPSGIHGATPATSFATGSLGWAATGLAITPAAGRASVGGSGYVRTVALTTVTATTNSHASFSRRDRIVLRRSLSTHNVVLAIITGTPASSPVAPSITRDDTTWDLPLFSFLVPPANGTTISGVLDERVWFDPYADAVAAFKAYTDNHTPMHGTASCTPTTFTINPSQFVTFNTATFNVYPGQRIRGRVRIRAQGTTTNFQTVSITGVTATAGATVVAWEPGYFRQGQLAGDAMQVIVDGEVLIDTGALTSITVSYTISAGSGNSSWALDNPSFWYTLGNAAP